MRPGVFIGLWIKTCSFLGVYLQRGGGRNYQNNPTSDGRLTTRRSLAGHFGCCSKSCTTSALVHWIHAVLCAARLSGWAAFVCLLSLITCGYLAMLKRQCGFAWLCFSVLLGFTSKLLGPFRWTGGDHQDFGSL